MSLGHTMEALRAREVVEAPLVFGPDVNAARYVRGARETVVAEVSVAITPCSFVMII